VTSESDAAPLIREFITSLSPDFVRRLIDLLRANTTVAQLTRARIMREVANHNACERIACFLDTLSAIRPGISPGVVAFGIECALETFTHEANLQRIDLVWTGPETSAVSVRRSAAVLLELIEGTQNDLIMMSFASFRIPDVEAALSAALNRGVRLYLISSRKKTAQTATISMARRRSALSQGQRTSHAILGQSSDAQAALCSMLRPSSAMRTRRLSRAQI
jgi:hypothetical protein